MEAPGWHGKLPTLGDFASRRLSVSFVEAWDSWLAEGISALQKADAAGWLQAYLDSPSWRFLLMPGALRGGIGTKAWAGVLMPSVDRVGRYFPFTIAQQLPSLPKYVPDYQQLSNWCDQLDAIAVEALFNDWTIDGLEKALQASPLPACITSAGQFSTATVGQLKESDEPKFHRSTLFNLLMEHALGSLALQKGATFWIGSAREERPMIVTTHGLPQGLDFAALFSNDATGGDLKQ